MIGMTLFDRWRVDGELGTGSFSTVYFGTDLTTLEPVAIKIMKPEASRSMLSNEIKKLVRLQACSSKHNIGVPRLLFSSNQPATLIIERVGRTLLDLFTEAKTMSMKSVLMVGMQVLTALEEVHAQGVVHNDIKPDNIAIGLQAGDGDLHLLDFGLSGEWMHRNVHVQYKEGWEFQGTPFFASENTLRGIRPSRRDDLESLGNILLFFQMGTLPWLDVRVASPNDIVNMLKARSKATQFIRDANPLFTSYFAYVKGLIFYEKPDYAYLRSLLEREMQKEELTCDWVYDWTKPEPKRHSKPHSNSLSRNMSLLSSDSDPSPGAKISKLRRNSCICLETPITPTHAPVLDGTRLRRFSQCVVMER